MKRAPQRFSRGAGGFLLVEMVTTLALTSIISLSLILAVINFEESEVTQELEVGVLAQLRYQAAVIRGLPLPTLKTLFSGQALITRTGPDDLKLYGILRAPTLTAQVTWQLYTADVEPNTGETLLAVTATVSAPLSVGGGKQVSRHVTVFRALE